MVMRPHMDARLWGAAIYGKHAPDLPASPSGNAGISVSA
jgi:hypothetical protein